MDHETMLRLFRAHREAEAARDFDAILATFVEDCFLDTVALGLRSEGRAAARAAYEAHFTAFPDITPDDKEYAFSEQTLVTWGTLRGTSGGDWPASWPGRVSTSTSPPCANRQGFRWTR